uniref:Uncharacterized protein n=1 Tax=Kalmanozyma brasiliensis (strain GHG001) TaxID=1365824 RepID=V5EUX5_KALBG
MLVKVYRVFDDEGKECRVLDESMALSKVTFLRTCCIHSVELELSSKGVTLWALAHFAQSTPTRSQ